MEHDSVEENGVPAEVIPGARKGRWHLVFEWKGWSAVTSVVTAFAAIFAVVVTLRSLQVTQEGQLADRFSKSVEQIGSEKLDVRLGGIYALEVIARDSTDNYATVMEVLSAFVREHAPASSCPPRMGTGEERKALATDIQAVITVLGRRDVRQDVESLDLQRSCLQGIRIKGANYNNANFSNSDMRAASIRDSSFRGADLEDVYLSTSSVERTDFSEANLAYAKAPWSKFTQLKFTHAKMVGVKFAGAFSLRGDDLSGADLTVADLSAVDLEGADLTGATLNGVVPGGGMNTAIGVTQWPPPAADCIDRENGFVPPHLRPREC